MATAGMPKGRAPAVCRAAAVEMVLPGRAHDARQQHRQQGHAGDDRGTAARA
jgi:hypothetical protein